MLRQRREQGGLTRRQADTLARIVRLSRRLKRPPSFTEVARSMRVALSTLWENVYLLKTKGYLRTAEFNAKYQLRVRGRCPVCAERLS